MDWAGASLEARGPGRDAHKICSQKVCIKEVMTTKVTSEVFCVMTELFFTVTSLMFSVHDIHPLNLRFWCVMAVSSDTFLAWAGPGAADDFLSRN